MDPITAAIVQLQLEVFRALPDAEKTRRAVSIETWSFSVQQAAHDMFPKFPPPPPLLPPAQAPVKTS